MRCLRSRLGFGAVAHRFSHFGMLRLNDVQTTLPFICTTCLALRNEACLGFIRERNDSCHAGSLNDSLPQEAGPTRWRWERGGWLLVDRVSGRAQPIALPEFDPNYSKASWFRDYVAYCGTSDDGQKLFAVIAQAGKRKPLLNKGLPEQTETCAPPVWQRGPVRVTFATKEDPKLTFTVTSRAVDLASEDENEGDD